MRLFALLIATALLFGCAATRDEVKYEKLVWLNDGRLLFQKAVNHYSGETLSGSDSEFYAIAADGSGEQRLNYSCYPYFSPGAKYIATIKGATVTIYQGSERLVYKTFDPTGETIAALDWNPAEDGFAYVTGSGRLRYVTKDNTGDCFLAADAEAVIWNSGSKIVFAFNDGSQSRLGLIGPDGSGRVDIDSTLTVGSPSRSKGTGEIIYGSIPQKLTRIDISGSPKYGGTMIYPFEGSNPTVSGDGLKVAYTDANSARIYVCNSDGSGVKQLK